VENKSMEIIEKRTHAHNPDAVLSGF